MDLSTSLSFIYWVGGILNIIILIVGFLGNACTIYILCQSQFRRSIFYNLIICLACFDTVCLLSFGSAITFKSFIDERYLVTIRTVTYTLQLFGLGGSIYTTVAISLERYLGVCHSMNRWKRTVWIYFIPVTIIDLILLTPPGIYMICVPNENYFRLSWVFYEALVFYWVIPLLSITVLNGLIVIDLRKPTIILDAQQQHRSRTVHILLWIVFVYFCCLVIPALVGACFIYFFCVDSAEGISMIRSVAYVAININSSVNIIIYCYVGENFRKEILKMLLNQKKPSQMSLPRLQHKVMMPNKLPFKTS